MPSTKIEKVSELIAVLKHRKAVAKKKIAKAKKELKQGRKEIQMRKDAILVLEYLANKKYDNVVNLFESTVSSALVDLFDESYGFKFSIGKRGDSTTCDFTVTTGEYDCYLDLKMNQGRSLAEVISAIMRIVLVKLDTSMPLFIILDEPFGGVEEEREPLLAGFLNKICKVFEIQLLIITQSSQFAEYAENNHDMRKRIKT